jgi:hypothetical protein
MKNSLNSATTFILIDLYQTNKIETSLSGIKLKIVLKDLKFAPKTCDITVRYSTFL